jgi:hypothetical protein
MLTVLGFSRVEVPEDALGLPLARVLEVHMHVQAALRNPKRKKKSNRIEHTYRLSDKHAGK